MGGWEHGRVGSMGGWEHGRVGCIEGWEHGRVGSMGGGAHGRVGRMGGWGAWEGGAHGWVGGAGVGGRGGVGLGLVGGVVHNVIIIVLYNRCRYYTFVQYNTNNNIVNFSCLNILKLSNAISEVYNKCCQNTNEHCINWQVLIIPTLSCRCSTKRQS